MSNRRTAMMAARIRQAVRTVYDQIGFRYVDIFTIPHERQRYNTVGYWFLHNSFLTSRRKLIVKVSRMMDWRYGMLVAIHELVEAFLCTDCGVRQEDVDAWDKAWEADPIKARSGEPGDHPRCPYRRPHWLATKIEKMLVKELGISWKEYDGEIERVWETRAKEER